MSIDKVGNELKNYFMSNAWFRPFLPLDEAIVYGTVALTILQNFLSLGALVSSLVYYLFFIGILLAFSNAKYLVLAIGLGGVGLVNAYSLIAAVFYKYLNYSALIGLAIYGLLAYLAYKKSMNSGSDQSIGM